MKQKWIFLVFFFLVVFPAIACDDTGDDHYQIRVNENNSKSSDSEPNYLYVEDK